MIFSRVRARLRPSKSPAKPLAQSPAQSPGPSAQQEQDAQQEQEQAGYAPLISHLAELRRRIFYWVVPLIGLFVLNMLFFAQPFFNFLIEPLADLQTDERARRFIFTAMHEHFLTLVKLSFFLAFFLSLPLFLNQIWLFVAPGLYRGEKRAFLPFLILTPVLFFSGAAFVYYFVMPLAWEFFTGFEQLSQGPDQLAIELEPKVNEYLALVLSLMLAFGLCFELPVIILLLVRAGLMTLESLKRKRRYIYLFSFVVAAILTPPDPVSQIGLASVMILLFEMSLWMAWLAYRKQTRLASELDPETSGAAGGTSSGTSSGAASRDTAENKAENKIGHETGPGERRVPPPQPPNLLRSDP